MKWDNLVNAESETGTWDFFNVVGELKLVKYKNNRPEFTMVLSEEEWVDLIKLVKSIS